MKQSTILSTFFYLTCLISLSLFLSCGDTEDMEEATDSTSNTLLDTPDERWLELKDEDWEKLKMRIG